jgi:malate/lactate dehydrogenase
LLVAENLYKKEIYKSLDYSNDLYMYEIYNENDEVVYYEIKTTQEYLNQTIFYIRSYDKKLLTKFLNELRKCEKRDFKKYITDYAKNNDNLVFLWDDYKIDDKNINEYFCYELE